MKDVLKVVVVGSLLFAANILVGISIVEMNRGDYRGDQQIEGALE